jgi:hypothetical protein
MSHFSLPLIFWASTTLVSTRADAGTTPDRG